MLLDSSTSLTPPVISGLAFVAILLLQIFFTRSTSALSDENRRRLQHLTTGQALIVVSYILPLHYCQILLLIACLLIIYIRFLHDAWYRQHFYTLLRPYELQYGVLPGALYFLVGVLVVATVCPLLIARYSVLCLSYADPMASWIGSTVYSKVKIHDGASVTGCTACFVTALVIGITTLGTNNIRVSVIGAVACMIAEAMPFWNDNVMIPIATASAVQWAMSF
jgi:dolichol kinase